MREVLNIIGDDFKFKPILHWFTGNTAELQEAVEKGFYFSVNGAMMASKRAVRLLDLIPKERVLIETDSPFTYLYGSYSNTLSRIKKFLKENKEGVDVWGNFKEILSK